MRRRGKQRPRALAGATCALLCLCFAAGLASCQSPPAAPTLMPGIAEAEQVSLQDEWVWDPEQECAPCHSLEAQTAAASACTGFSSAPSRCLGCHDACQALAAAHEDIRSACRPPSLRAQRSGKRPAHAATTPPPWPPGRSAAAPSSTATTSRSTPMRCWKPRAIPRSTAPPAIRCTKPPTSSRRARNRAGAATMPTVSHATPVTRSKAAASSRAAAMFAPRCGHATLARSVLRAASTRSVAPARPSTPRNQLRCAGACRRPLTRGVSRWPGRSRGWKASSGSEAW